MRQTPERPTIVGMEIEIAPFAEYISARLGTPANAPADSRPDVQDNYPLAVSRQTMALLRLSASAPSTKEEQAARHRKAALLRRICDPILSLHDVALLLGVSADSVLRAAAMGALTSCEPAPRTWQPRRRRGEETGLPGFRLSDIVAFLVANGAAEAE